MPEPKHKAPRRAWPGRVWARYLYYVGLWLLLYAVLLTAYNYFYRITSEILIYRLQVRPAARIVSWLNPGLPITFETISISSSRVRLLLMRGCDGVEAWVILLSALLVFPMPWGRRWRGILWGTLLIFGLNQLRVISLFQIILHKPDWFEWAHGMVWQTAMTLAAALFAWGWITSGPDAHSGPEDTP